MLKGMYLDCLNVQIIWCDFIKFSYFLVSETKVQVAFLFLMFEFSPVNTVLLKGAEYT